MKPPGWMKQVGGYESSPDGRSVIVTFRIRLWHPGFWWYLLRHWRDLP